MVSWFHGFLGVDSFIGFVVSMVLWFHRFHGFYGFRGVNSFIGFMVS